MKEDGKTDSKMALELINITAGYGREPVLKDVSLSVKKGQRLAILGRNGSGKTTLLRVIAGLLPCSGTVRICGENVHSLKREELARRVAMMSQFAGAGCCVSVAGPVFRWRSATVAPVRPTSSPADFFARRFRPPAGLSARPFVRPPVSLSAGLSARPFARRDQSTSATT